MLKENNIYEFKIIDIGINFEGIAKADDGLTVFIPHALINETVLAKVLKVTKSYALATICKIISKSDLRIESDCQYFKKCGGCMCHHTTYDNTLDIKRLNVINTLNKQGVVTSKVGYIYGMSNPYNYRNKLQYPVRQINNKTVMGMFEANSHRLIENKYCLIQDEIIDKVARDLFNAILKYNLRGYDEINGTGDIRNIMVRRGTNTNEIMCVLVINNKDCIEKINPVVMDITKKYDDIKSFILNYNNKKTNVILSNENICIYGNDYITDIIGEYRYKITADSFFQVNTHQAEVLYNRLKENMKLDKNKNLLELYSGVGSIGMFLSDRVSNVYAVEIVESAVNAAKENAKLNNVTNVINVVGDATRETLRLVNEGKHFDYVVVDPPRKGLDLEGVELILKLKPEKIGYVSCNPATLARDLKLLSFSYEIEIIELVDLFPWTSHVESVAILKLK